MATDILTAFEVTLKFNKIHNALLTLFGTKEFKEKCAKYQEIIDVVKTKAKVDTLPAILKILSWPEVKDNEVQTMWFIATAVEMINNEEDGSKG